VALSPDGYTLASGNADNSIRLWNLNLQNANCDTNHPAVISAEHYSDAAC
jgi:WD40 repeat protein